MKNFFLAIAAVLLCSAVSAQKGYIINGAITGKAEGMKVYLRTSNWESQKTVDSTIIKDGRFTFSGKLAAPAAYAIVIDKTPKGEKSSEKAWLLSRFYLENSNIIFTGDIETLPPYYYSRNSSIKQAVIKGSAEQDEYVTNNAALSDINKELGKVNTEYLKVYHVPAMEGKFNTEEGIALARKEDSLSKLKQDWSMAYIAQYPASAVAYDMAYEKVGGMFISITEKQIDDLTAMVRKGWDGTPNMAMFEKAANKAKETAIGTKYQDFEMTTPDGKKTMLSEFVQKGKYVMLEFWASWCGPCRGEIPHLKHLHETKSQLFDIVSISLDESDKDWKKAMKDEGMNWAQVVDPHGFEGEIAKAYNIMGIPHSIVLDKEGRIMKIGLRGAHLDAYLEDLEGKK